MKVFRSQSNQWSIGVGLRRSTIFDGWRWTLWVNHGYSTWSLQWKMNPPRPAAGVQPCRKCGGAMQPSKAISPATSVGDEGTVSQAAHVGVAPQVDCMKCTACGWSVSAGVQEDGRG